MRRLLLAFGTIVACAQAPVRTAPGIVQALPAAEYNQLIKKHTRTADQYAGFYQTFQASATILTGEVSAAVLKQRGAFLQWEDRTYQSEREKSVQDGTAYAKFFLKFYSPETDYDDLDKGTTIWKLYLEYGGSRFEGKVRKLREKAVEIQTLFPHMDGFSTPYEVSFNIPMATIENGAPKLVLTSSLGSAEFKFANTK